MTKSNSIPTGPQVSLIMNTRFATCLASDAVVSVVSKVLASSDKAVLVLKADGSLDRIITETDLLPKRTKVPFTRGDKGDFNLQLWGFDVNKGLLTALKEAQSKGVTVGTAIRKQTTTHTIPSTTSIIEAIRVMQEHNIRRLPVVDGTKVVGLVTYHQILTYEAGLAAL
jgi:CBS domain-containing protein